MLYVKFSEVSAMPDVGYFFHKNLMIERWHFDLHKKPNTWAVISAQGSEVASWINSQFAYGVMDDFGNLVKVA